MRYIEVEKSAFDWLFTSDEQKDNCTKVDYERELTFEVHYWNGVLDIVGRTMFHEVSQTTQYYLRDTNA